MSPQDHLAGAFAYAETQIALGDALEFGALLFRAGSSAGFFIPLSGSFAQGFPDLLDDLDYLSELALQVEADAACLLLRAPLHSLPGVDASGSGAQPEGRDVIVAALHLNDGGVEQRAVRLLVDQDGPALIEAPASVPAPGILAVNLFSHESPHRRDEVARDLVVLQMQTSCPDWVRAVVPAPTRH